MHLELWLSVIWMHNICLGVYKGCRDHKIVVFIMALKCIFIVIWVWQLAFGRYLCDFWSVLFEFWLVYWLLKISSFSFLILSRINFVKFGPLFAVCIFYYLEIYKLSWINVLAIIFTSISINFTISDNKSKINSLFNICVLRWHFMKSWRHTFLLLTYEWEKLCVGCPL